HRRVVDRRKSGCPGHRGELPVTRDRLITGHQAPSAWAGLDESSQHLVRPSEHEASPLLWTERAWGHVTLPGENKESPGPGYARTSLRKNLHNLFLRLRNVGSNLLLFPHTLML